MNFNQPTSYVDNVLILCDLKVQAFEDVGRDPCCLWSLHSFASFSHGGMFNP